MRLTMSVFKVPFLNFHFRLIDPIKLDPAAKAKIEEMLLHVMQMSLGGGAALRDPGDVTEDCPPPASCGVCAEHPYACEACGRSDLRVPEEEAEAHAAALDRTEEPDLNDAVLHGAYVREEDGVLVIDAEKIMHSPGLEIAMPDEHRFRIAVTVDMHQAPVGLSIVRCAASVPTEDSCLSHCGDPECECAAFTPRPGCMTDAEFVVHQAEEMAEAVTETEAKVATVLEKFGLTMDDIAQASVAAVARAEAGATPVAPLTGKQRAEARAWVPNLPQGQQGVYDAMPDEVRYDLMSVYLHEGQGAFEAALRTLDARNALADRLKKGGIDPSAFGSSKF